MSSEHVWFACHTKPRCEKKFAGLLEHLGWEHYLPLVEKKHRYGKHTRVYSTPLFPGYVFAKIPLENKAHIFQQQLVVRTIAVPDEKIFLAQLDSIRALIASGMELVLKPLLARGTRVRITDGPLFGTEAEVEDPSKDEGIVIAIDVLRQGVLVKVPRDHLEIVD